MRQGVNDRRAQGRALSLKGVALVSGVYDLALALPMLVAPVTIARLFGAPDPVPVLNAQLNGVFTLALAAGYFWAARDTEARRGYFWVAGVLAKGLGAALFVGITGCADRPRRSSSLRRPTGRSRPLTLVALLAGARRPVQPRVSTGCTRSGAAAPLR